jgi:hypothetical protein
MTKLISVLVTVVVGMAMVAIVAPRLAGLASALIPLVLVLGVVVAVLRVVWFYTRRW